MASNHEMVCVWSVVTSVRDLGIRARNHDVAHKWHAMLKRRYTTALTTTVIRRRVGMKTLATTIGCRRVGTKALTTGITTGY